MSPAVPVLEMMNVTVASGRQAEVAEIEGINWRAGAGDFWVIGGMHSSGKTDFVSTASGLQRPLSGTVSIFGKDFFALHEEELLSERKRVGVVFEHGGRMFRKLSVLQNVALPLRYHDDLTDAEAERAAMPLLEAVGLTAVAQQPVAAVNPIMQQRTGLARALALKPELLFLDKPLIASKDRRWWPEFLKKLSDGLAIPEGKRVTVVVTTEDLQPWTEFGKQFAILKNKKWQPLGGQAEISGKMEPILRDFWSEGV